MSKIYEALIKKTGSPAPADFPDMFTSTEPAAAIVTSEASTAPKAAPAPTPAVAREKASGAAQESLDWDRIRRVSLQVADVSPVLPFGGEHPAAAEQYRLLRTRIMQGSGGKHPRFLLVSSAGPGDGKTVTAINLAGALSLKSGAKVVLIDGDLRRSSIHKALGINNTPGLAEVMSGEAALEEAVVRAVEFPNLYILPAGDVKSNPSELFDSARWREVVAALRGSFDHVVSDCPPIAAVADFDLLEAACDGVVVVVRPDHTSKAQLNAALRRISIDKLAGTVLNCFTPWMFRRTPDYTSYLS